MKTWMTKKDELLTTPLPLAQKRYGVIPHSVFLNEIQEKLENKGYEITQERYLTANNNQVMTGTYSLKPNSWDSGIEISPAVTFVNSYNKTRKAELKAGVMVLVCSNGMIGLKGERYSRKHLGNEALNDFREHINNVIDGVKDEFDRLLLNIEEMKAISLNNVRKALLIGDMFLNNEIILPAQLSILKREIKTSQNFTGDSAYDFYQNVTESFKENHPLNYDRQMVRFHSYISDMLQLSGATNLFKSIF